MKPVFCAEVFTEVTTATFDVTWLSSGTPFSVSWDVPAGLFWLGGLAYSGAPSLGDAFCDELDAADPNIGGDWSYTVQSLDPNVGAVGRLRRTIPPSTPTVTATNAAGEHVLWSLGFRNTSAVVMTSSTSSPLVSRYADTDGIPFATWWPKAYNVIQERYNPVSVAAFTSPLPGSGSTVASVRMEPTTQSRHWRSWQVLPIDAARCSIQRATSQVDTTWATEAGLTTNPGDAALDNPDWWWSRVLDGSHQFAAIEDEAELVSGTPRYGIYRIVYDSDAPMNMEPFKGLRAPILSQWSPAGARQQLEFCAIRTAAGNL